MAAAGYSGTPLLKKLGVKDGLSGLLINVPNDATELNAFSNWKRLKKAKTNRGISGGPFGYIHFFTANEQKLREAIPLLKTELEQNGMIWVSWPKKSSGVQSSVTEGTIRSLALKRGLVDIKVCAINEVWSGLKLVIPVKDRKK